MVFFFLALSRYTYSLILCCLKNEGIPSLIRSIVDSVETGSLLSDVPKQSVRKRSLRQEVFA